MRPSILSLALRYERDIVLARQRARQVAAMLKFDAQTQTRISTAVSEIARNAFRYAGGGIIDFTVEGETPPQVLLIRVTDRGPGIPDLRSVLEGRYRSSTGMGLGIIGARRLMDQFDVESGPHGTTVTLKKLLPRREAPLDARAVERMGEELARQEPTDPLEELQRQNQEVLRAFEELSRRQEELAALNRELEDTNRGVVALYAELDEKADHLRRADELKSRFLSNMTHEFRTPVNSIQALSRMLLDRTDGDLSPEQERQVGFIRKAADSLSELVNDLLDLAKVEAGKTVVRPVEFDVASLFSALRGMLRPLLVNESIDLVFEDPDGVPAIYGDEGKVSQILRNFISNALKFTERGEIRVTARVAGAGVELAVSDTGIGIAADDLDRVFQEFSQVDSPIQRRVRGTGLGLPLCRRLAELLGGGISVESTLGCGSTFTLTIPVAYDVPIAQAGSFAAQPGRLPLLVVDDSVEAILYYEKLLSGAGFQIVPARTLRDARCALASLRPAAILLDILLQGEDAWELLTELKRRDETRDIPVIVVSSVEDERKGLALGADAYLIKPVDRQRLLHAVTSAVAPATIRRILVVDDEEVFRYVLRQHLTTPHYVVSEAADGEAAVEAARADPPDVICLDLAMPGRLGGAEVLEQLKADPETAGIPVVLVTSMHLGELERTRLLGNAAAILAKDAVSKERALAVVEDAMRGAGAP